MDKIGLLNSAGGWIVEVFAVVFVALLIDLIQKGMLNRLHKRLVRTANPWDDALVVAVRKPLSALIWIVGIAFAASIMQQRTESAIFQAVPAIRDVLVVVVLAWFLLRLISGVQANLIEQKQARGEEVDRTTVEAIGKLLRASVAITAALVILQTLGYSISGVLAFGGIGGVAVGFAAKDVLANFFGGLMVYLDRPFVVGEWIRSPDRDIEGTVEQIGWRLTRIRTFDKRLLYVPNATFASIAVQNPSRMSHRRIYETVGIRYDDVDKMRTICDEVRAMLEAHPGIDQSQLMMVYFNSFGPSSLDFFVYTFTRTTVWAEYHAVKHDVLLKIHDIIAKHGAEVAFPTSTVHLPDTLHVSTEQGGGEPRAAN